MIEPAALMKLPHKSLESQNQIVPAQSCPLASEERVQVDIVVGDVETFSNRVSRNSNCIPCPLIQVPRLLSNLDIVSKK